MWIIAYGPVGAIWIEDLSTVLDDNKILTLANGEIVSPWQNIKLLHCLKIMFEVETLVNASPATVSRAGIIYVSETDLDWAPVLEAWFRKRSDIELQTLLRTLIEKLIGSSTPTDPGPFFDSLILYNAFSFTQLFYIGPYRRPRMQLCWEEQQHCLGKNFCLLFVLASWSFTRSRRSNEIWLLVA